MINANKNRPSLDWICQQFIADDMELVGYYLLDNNKVR